MNQKTDLNEYREINTHSNTPFVNLLLEYGEKFNVKVEDKIDYENQTSTIWCKGILKDLIKLDKKCRSEFLKLESKE